MSKGVHFRTDNGAEMAPLPFFFGKQGMTTREEPTMAGMREGEIRIPSGCAIAAVISREGKKMTGEAIMESMKPMHDRSNGLGGGFAGYGIYPEYKDYYALHLFFDCRDTRKECEAFLYILLFHHYLPLFEVSRIKHN